jgi:hypothetical protein
MLEIALELVYTFASKIKEKAALFVAKFAAGDVVFKGK